MKRQAQIQSAFCKEHSWSPVSWTKNKSTGDERQKLFEAVLDILDERLRDFRDGPKLIRIKRSVARGEMTEWDAEANVWCANVFKIISEAWPSLKDIREFHNLLATAGIAATPETRITVALQISRMKGKSERRRKPRQDFPHSNTTRNPERLTLELPDKASSSRETSGMSPSPLGDKGPVINADTKNTESVRTSGHQKAAQGEYLRRKAVSTRRQSVGQTRTFRSSSSPVIAVDTSDSQGDGHSSGSDASSDNKLGRGKMSARENFEDLHSILSALEDVAKHPNNASKYDEARSVIRNTNLGEYYTQEIRQQNAFLQLPIGSMKEDI